MDQGSFPTVLLQLIKCFICMSGQHDLEVGASRYMDALIDGREGWDDYPSGTYVSSKKGYIGDVCDVTAELKKGKVFADEAKQDLVYEAVRQFL